MRNSSSTFANNEPVTACIYDEQHLGIWLVFTRDEPEFVANIDKNAYQKTLAYLTNYSSKRNNLYRFFEALKAN